MFVATLVHPSRLPSDLVAAASGALAQAGARVGDADWLAPGLAADLMFEGLALADARAALARFDSDADVIVQPVAGRRKRLLIADMDSTMITCECIDELADYAGFKAQVAAVTEAAMRGELDFVAALDGRVALLKGLDAAVIDRCRAERVRLMPGAQALVRTMRANGAATILVSGGFTAFAEPVGAEIGFAKVVANVLDIAGGQLAGTVARPVVDSATKLRTLQAEAAAHGLALADCLAVGDGANDIPMIEAAGLGIAYHAKPKTRAAAQAAVTHGDLTALLYAQGYRRSDWVSA
jgi:phosphoserine phosphatase